MNKSLSNGKYIIYNPAFKDIGESREKEGKQGENPYYGGCKKVCVVKDRNKNESKS